MILYNSHLHYLYPKSFKSYLANINLINVFFGYVLVTFFLIPIFGESSTQIITVPYRAFSLLLSLIVIISHFDRKLRLPFSLRLLIIFWIFTLLRIFIDLEIIYDSFVPNIFKQRINLTTIFVITIPLISFIFSYRSLSFTFCLKWSFILGVIFIFSSYLTSVQIANLDERIDLNDALNSINFNIHSSLVFLICIYLLINFQFNLFKKIFLISICLLCLYISLRSGSRGPILSLVLILTLWLSLLRFNFFKSFFIVLSMFCFLYIFLDFFLDLLNLISPITYNRINLALNGNELSYNQRVDSYSYFWNLILDSPIFGSHFAVVFKDVYPIYAHNIFLDILLSLGLVGVLLFSFILYLIFKDFNFLLKNNLFYLFHVFSIYFFFCSLTSNAYYTNPYLLLAFSLSLLFSYNYYSITCLKINNIL